MYANLYKKKKKLHVDNEFAVYRLCSFKENRSKINVGKREIAFNEHEQFLLSHYVCWVFII